MCRGSTASTKITIHQECDLGIDSFQKQYAVLLYIGLNDFADSWREIGFVPTADFELRMPHPYDRECRQENSEANMLMVRGSIEHGLVGQVSQVNQSNGVTEVA